MKPAYSKTSIDAIPLNAILELYAFRVTCEKNQWVMNTQPEILTTKQSKYKNHFWLANETGSLEPYFALLAQLASMY